MSRFLPACLGIGMVLIACGRQPGNAARDSVAAAQPDTSATAAVDSMQAIDSTPVAHSPDSTKAVPPPPVRPRPDTAGSATPSVPQIPTATVGEILGSSTLVGKTVRVTGTCLGYRVPPVAVGNPPRTRSDWQLESNGAAVYVTGPMPAGCSATAGSTVPSTLIATVVEDTMRALGTNPARARRYLEIKGGDRLPVRQP